MDSNLQAQVAQGVGRRTWLAGSFAIVALVVLAIVALVLAAGREAAVYPTGSPEAAFQQYAAAWDAGDLDTAWGSLTLRAQGRLSEWEFRDANTWRDDEKHRVWIDERSGADDRVVLHLTIETIYDGGLFGSGRYEDASSVTMVREDGDWKIDTPLVGYSRW
jgi:hypothetical protein